MLKTSFFVSRRRFLAGAGAAAGLSLMPRGLRRAAASQPEPVVLDARAGTARLLEETKAETPIWGYRGQVPGPLLRVKQGGMVHVRLQNSLPQPTTIHWHGIRIDNAMDGVAGLTQEPAPPGGTFDYRFTAPDAGTFWYHPHNRSWEQVARGLYGVLIVEEPEPPDVDQDILLVFDDWRLTDGGKLHEESFGSIHDRAHAGRLGNILTLNSQPVGRLPVRAGERARVRLCNMCNSRVLALQLEGLAPQVIAIDGQPVPPYPLKDARVLLAPAQRMDLAVDFTAAPGSASAITEISQERLVAGNFVYDPKASVPARKHALRLPQNRLPAPDENSARMIDLAMTGGAMGQLERAVYKGREFGLRELVRAHGMVWAFNGVAGMPDKPLFSARRGESVAIRMVNDTRWPHAMHIHGHHFREPKPGAPWRDTILLDVGETRTALFAADNPGKWMIHCHMLEHQAGGMGTWFEVGG